MVRLILFLDIFIFSYRLQTFYLIRCKRTDSFDEVGMRFVVHVWDQIEVNDDFKKGSAYKVIVRV